MIKKKEVAVLDIGSYKITVIVAERGINNTFNIKGTGEVEYTGFSDGQFFEPNDVKNAIALAIANAETSAHIKISHLYIGVPGEFTSVICRECNINFPKRKKVLEQDINQLFYVGNIYRKHPTHTVINNTPIYFTLDDSRKIIDPVGMASSRLGGYISYVLAENNFLDFIEGILEELGIKSAEYISSCLAESMYLFDAEIRDRYALLLDCGYLTSSVMLIRGDGLLFLKTFSIGGGHIMGDLAECLRISISQAENLKRKVVLSIDATDSDYYEVAGKDYLMPISAKTANEIVKARVDHIASMVLKCLNKCEYEIPDYIPMYLTGGGLSYMRGARDYFSKKIGRRVEIVSPTLPNLNRPHFSSTFGLLDMALDENQNNLSTLFGH